MTFDEYRNQLEVKLLQKAAEFVEVGDIDECKNCISGIEELNRVLSTLGNNPRQEVGDTNADVVKSKSTEEQTDETEPSEPEEVNPTHPGGDFDLDDAIEYTKEKVKLDEDELFWLNKLPTCKAGEPKADGIHLVTANGLRKAMNRGCVRGYKPDADIRYFRYSVILHKHEIPDPWGGLIEE